MPCDSSRWKATEEELKMLDNNSFFTREHLETYTKEQLIELLLTIPKAVDTVATAIGSKTKGRNMPYDNDRLGVWELLFMVGLTILIAAVPMSLVYIAAIMILGA